MESTPTLRAPMRVTRAPKRRLRSVNTPAEECDIVWVAIYLRVSTDGQVDGFGLDAQLKLATDYIAKHPNWRLYEVYRDEGVSGTLLSRPGADRMVEDARTAKFTFVVVGALDRVSREEYVGYYIEHQLQECHVEVVSATQDSNPYEVSKLMRGVQRAIDAEDRRKILRNTNNGRQEAAEGGFWTGGPAPFGYEIQGQGKKRSTIIINLKEKRCLLRIYELFVEEKLNSEEAAAQLNAEGYRTARGKMWTRHNLLRLANSESVLEGTSTFRKTKMHKGSGHSLTKLGPDGQPLLGETIVRVLPVILTAEQRNLLKIALGVRSKTPSGDSEYFLSGGHVVGTCGKHYTGGGETKDGIRRYRCGGKDTSKGATKCTDMHLRADLLEETVMGQIRELFKDTSRMNKLADEWMAKLPNERKRHETNIATLEVEVEKQRVTLQNLTTLLANPAMDPDEREITTGSRAMVMQTFKTAKDSLEQARERLAQIDETNQHVLRMAGLVREAQVRIDDLNYLEKLALLKLLKIRVVIADAEARADHGKNAELEDWHRETGTAIPADPDDEIWPRVMDAICQRNRGYLRRDADPEKPRVLVRAILHRLRTGCAWAALPEEFVPGAFARFTSVATAQTRLWRNGTWQEVITLLADQPGATPLKTPTALPKLVITGRIGPDVLGEDGSELRELEPSSRGMLLDSTLFSFSIKVG